MLIVLCKTADFHEPYMTNPAWRGTRSRGEAKANTFSSNLVILRDQVIREMVFDTKVNTMLRIKTKVRNISLLAIRLFPVKHPIWAALCEMSPDEIFCLFLVLSFSAHFILQIR